MAVPAPAWLAACDLPRAWQGRDAWRVLDTDFDDGKRFLPLWDTWARDPRAVHSLHVVCITPCAPDPRTLANAAAAFPALAPHAQELQRQWFGLLPGFHRLVLHEGRLRLTLCIGPVPLVLRELRFEADAIVLVTGGVAGSTTNAAPPAWDKHSVKALARLSRRGTGLLVWPHGATAPALICQAGFVHSPSTAGSGTTTSGISADASTADKPTDIAQAYQFQPHWQVATTRSHWRHPPSVIGQCVVIGAGLAGATVADALAARGWQVTVLDAASSPAAGASGLPVGLLAPQVSRDDNPRSRLCRAGIRMALQAAARLLRHGQDWAWTGVAELDPRSDRSLPDDWPLEARQWTRPGLPDIGAGNAQPMLARGSNPLWHAGAGWMKPARLVQACLSRPGVRFVGAAAVQSIERIEGTWQVRSATGALLAQAPQLVIACAGDATRLINQALQTVTPGSRLAPLTAVDGQVSWAAHAPDDVSLFPPFPVNGSGSVVGHMPHGGATAWFAGATYGPAQSAAAPGLNQSAPSGLPVVADPADPAVSTVPTALANQSLQAERTTIAADHAQNQHRIAQLLPAAARALAAQFANGQVNAWRGTRWTTHDRLPIAGAVDAQVLPGLWVSAAMGSRGLTYSVLCAEVIAAQIGAEPLPLETRLLGSISASRRSLLHHL